MKKILVFSFFIISLQSLGQAKDSFRIYDKGKASTSSITWSDSSQMVSYFAIHSKDGDFAKKYCDTCKWVIDGDINRILDSVMEQFKNQNKDVQKYHELRNKVYEMLIRGYNRAPNNKTKEHL